MKVELREVTDHEGHGRQGIWSGVGDPDRDGGDRWCLWSDASVLLLLSGLIEGRVPWVAWLFMIAFPETVLVAIALKWWSRRRWMAVGVLIPAAILAVHFAMHVANHFRQ